MQPLGSERLLDVEPLESTVYASDKRDGGRVPERRSELDGLSCGSGEGPDASGWDPLADVPFRPPSDMINGLSRLSLTIAEIDCEVVSSIDPLSEGGQNRDCKLSLTLVISGLPGGVRVQQSFNKLHSPSHMPKFGRGGTFFSTAIK